MNERLKKITVTVKDKWTGFSTAVKVLLIAIPVAIIAIIVILSVLLNQEDTAVLYSGLSASERSEVVSVIQSLGVEDVSVDSDGNVLVSPAEVDYLRMELSVLGYPKTSTNYDIWNDGVDLWSTDTDKREIMRQQRETNLAATLSMLESVASATVTLDIPTTRDYVITTTDEVPTCSVLLKLRTDEELTNAEVRGIFRLIETSVENLTVDNISVTDTLGRSYLWISEEEEQTGETDASGVTIARRRLQFLAEMQAAITSSLKDTLQTVYGVDNFTVNVSATLNYDATTIQSTEYLPVGDTDHGVLEHNEQITAYDGLEDDSGLVGVTSNADTSPDYPTIEGLVDGESYYYSKNENQYDVSNIITTIEKDGYSIDKLTVGVAVNQTNLTDAEREQIQQWIAMAAGTEVENVAVYNVSFAIPTNSGTTVDAGSIGIYTSPVDSFRNTLLFVVIGLGILLVILLIASLFVSRSRKHKIRRRQEMALAAAQAGGGDGGYTGMTSNEQPQEIDFSIASLTEEAGKDSRETILKREIAEFATTNPEIVASIIKNMLRDDEK